MDSGDRAHLSLLGRPELGVTFTKLHCWTLTQYSKCVFLDADTLVLCNVDELFEREELSAAPDPGWPDCFNSGVFVFRPSLDTHARLVEHAQKHGSFDGGDQGLLNTFFGSWAAEDISKHLPFIYNLSANAVYTYLPAFQQYGHNAKIVHFLGAVKPWSCRSDAQTEGYTGNGIGRFVTLWWKEFLSHAEATAATVPPPPQTCDDLEKLQQSQAKEAKVPFRGKLDTHNSLLAHFSQPTDGPHPPPEVAETRFQPGDVLLEDEGLSCEEMEDQRPSSCTEGSDADSDTNSDNALQRAAETEAEQLEHRRLWETGRADYLGRDAFHNIQRKLDAFLN
ncbi:glycogenin-2 isoform X2 [Lampris incognitus]|nr:glycogenin-2 isoform X2 [Lampris incognitus]